MALVISMTLVVPAALAESKKTTEREPDSEYVEKKPASKRREGGGLFDFLPFVDTRPSRVEPEKLKPSQLPQESKPVLSKQKLEQLQQVAERWLLTTEFAEPTVRRDENDKYYRDYIVFAGEYEAKVIRGGTEQNPFIGHVYVKGDYFKTQSHDTPEAVQNDFKFKYQEREFRVIFDRMEKWEYSDNPDAEPFVFGERWEFRGLQSRPVVELSGEFLSPERTGGEEKKADPSEPEKD